MYTIIDFNGLKNKKNPYLPTTLFELAFDHFLSFIRDLCG
jgi:hypothetical protein